MGSALLTTEEACQLLKVSKTALYTYVKAKEIPGFKFGRRWKFPQADLEKWVAKKMKEAN